MADPKTQNAAGLNHGGVHAQLSSGVQFGGGRRNNTAQRSINQQFAERIAQHQNSAATWTRLAVDSLDRDEAALFLRVAAKHRSEAFSLGGAS